MKAGDSSLTFVLAVSALVFCGAGLGMYGGMISDLETEAGGAVRAFELEKDESPPDRLSQDRLGTPLPVPGETPMHITRAASLAQAGTEFDAWITVFKSGESLTPLADLGQKAAFVLTALEDQVQGLRRAEEMTDAVLSLPPANPARGAAVSLLSNARNPSLDAPLSRLVRAVPTKQTAQTVVQHVEGLTSIQFPAPATVEALCELLDESAASMTDGARRTLWLALGSAVASLKVEEMDPQGSGGNSISNASVCRRGC